MMNIRRTLRVVDATAATDPGNEPQRLDQVFFALSDPVRRQILERLDGQALLVSELAAPFDISLQAVSRHIQVLVRAGLIQQERSGRISKCSLDAGPLLDAAVWMNRYSKYWQQQFDVLAATLAEIDARQLEKPKSERANKTPRRRTKRRDVPDT
jgi:DNA-binding transcriptional ArsR family regulator